LGLHKKKLWKATLDPWPSSATAAFAPGFCSGSPLSSASSLPDQTRACLAFLWRIYDQNLITGEDEKAKTYNSEVMYLMRLSTFIFASSMSCFTKTGPIILKTVFDGFNRTNS